MSVPASDTLPTLASATILNYPAAPACRDVPEYSSIRELE